MISSRYALIVGLLLGLALVPTVIHSYYRLMDQDGLATAAVDADFDGFQATPTQRKDQWVKEMFDSTDWIERDYAAPHGGSVRLFAARSYDHKRLYHHPELAVLYGIDLEDAGIEWLAGPPEIPVRLLKQRTGTGVAAYALLYDDRFVSNPIGFQLKTSITQVVSARKPLTLLLVYDKAFPAHGDFADSPAARVLWKAIESFRSQQVNAVAANL